MSIEIGDTVLWFEGGVVSKDSGRPALVTGIGSHPGVMPRLTLNAADSRTANFRIREGVCHHADPAAKNDERRLDGVWCETPQHLRLADALAQLDLVIEAVGPDKLAAAKSVIEQRKIKEEAKRKEKEEFERSKKKVG